MRELVERGHLERPDPDAPGQFAWARPGTIEEHLDAAGFGEHEVDTVDFALVLPVRRRLDRHAARPLVALPRGARRASTPPSATTCSRPSASRRCPYVQEDGSIVLPARTWVAVASA